MEEMSQLLRGTKVRFYDSETPWMQDNLGQYAREDRANIPDSLAGRLNFSVGDGSGLIIAIDKKESIEAMRRHVLSEYFIFSDYTVSKSEEMAEQVLSNPEEYGEFIGAVDKLLKDAGTEYVNRKNRVLSRDTKNIPIGVISLQYAFR